MEEGLMANSMVLVFVLLCCSVGS